MIRSNNDPNVFWTPQGTLCQGDVLVQGWYYQDETGGIQGPYVCERDAILFLRQYVDRRNAEIEGEVNPGAWTVVLRKPMKGLPRLFEDEVEGHRFCQADAEAALRRVRKQYPESYLIPPVEDKRE